MRSSSVLRSCLLFSALLLGCATGAQAPTDTPRAGPVPTSAPTVPAQPSPTPASVAPKPSPTTKAVGPKYGGTLTNRIAADPEKWDPHDNHLENNQSVFNLVHGRLLSHNYGAPACLDDPPEGDLAESWTWLDDLTLDIKLRPGIRFQGAAPVGNRELVAEDVVHSMKDSYAREDYMKPNADITRDISAVDKYTVRFRLSQPYVDYVKMGPVRYPVVILAPELNTAGKKWTFRDHVGTGTGPFVLKDYLPGVKVELEKNPGYFKAGLPYLDAMTLLIVPDESTAVSLLRSGRIDVALILGAPAVDAIKLTAPKLAVQTCGYHASTVVFWRTDKPPFNNVQVRRALSMAVDRDAFNKTVWLGTGTPRWSPVHPLLGDWAIKPEAIPADVRQYTEYHPDRAKTLLASAGYATGPEVKLVYRDVFASVAEAIHASWTSVGAKVTLAQLERGAYNTAVVEKADYEDAALSYASALTVDEAIYTYFRSGMPRNRSHMGDPELDRMLDAQRTMLDESQRKKVVDEIQIRLMRDQYMLVLPMSSRSWVLQPWVKNTWYKPPHSAVTEFLRFAWLDK